MNVSRHPRPGPAAFTLLELLAVVAIIGILAAIVIPTTAAVRASALRARTRVQLGQWAVALVLFREEYGAYPLLAASGKVNAGAGPGLAAVHPFHDLLSGRRRDGSALPETPGAAVDGVPPPEAQNVRHLAFVRFAATDLYTSDAPTPAESGLLHDAFGNPDLAVLVDRDQDGWINVRDYPAWPAVSPPDAPDRRLVPAEPIASGVRTGVLIYGAPPGALSAEDLVRNVP
jgi:prepilin-type N-terminal cleavage/methylation domain-containing protein